MSSQFSLIHAMFQWFFLSLVALLVLFIFLQYYLHTHVVENHGEETAREMVVMNVTREISILKNTTIALEPLELPKTSIASLTPQISAYKGTIFSDFAFPSDELYLSHYENLDSWLEYHPHCKVLYLLIAPVAANYYKWGNKVSKMQFQSYAKSGKSVQTKVVVKSPWEDRSIPMHGAHRKRAKGLKDSLGMVCNSLRYVL